ncbi:MAG: hypothetical protein PHI98_09665 [Eubacteriales bacterium]|nr:hypothetical protein [Eubacteriales bacterium]
MYSIKTTYAESVVDSTAAELNKSIRDDGTSKLKADYLQAVDGGDNAKAKLITAVLRDALGMEEREVKYKAASWVKEHHNGQLYAAVEAGTRRRRGRLWQSAKGW